MNFQTPTDHTMAEIEIKLARVCNDVADALIRERTISDALADAPGPGPGPLSAASTAPDTAPAPEAISLLRSEIDRCLEILDRFAARMPSAASGGVEFYVEQLRVLLHRERDIGDTLRAQMTRRAP